MRDVFITIVFCIGLLLVFTTAQQQQLANAIKERVAASVQKSINARPVDHQYTLFSGVLVEQTRESLPNVANSESSISARYELIAMSPCNPRIQRCN